MNITDPAGPAFSPRLLDFFFLVAAILILNGTSSARHTATARFLGLALVIVLVGLWVWWRRRRSGVIAIAFACAAAMSYLVVDSLMSIVCQWVALIVLELSLPRIAGYLYGALLIASTTAVHLAAGSDPSRILGESMGVLLLVVAGISFARLIKRAETLDRQRRESVIGLAAANRALERHLRVSRDLVLSRERERVAADLHDGLGHRLTTIGLGLDFVDRMVERDPARAREELTRARSSVSTALDEMRATVRAMAPVEVAAGDIRETLARLAASFTGTGLTVSFTSSGTRVLSEDLNQLLLRCTQEALTNVIRHAAADQVVIRLTDIELRIADNGRGSDAEPGYGLRSLSRRAADFGAAVATRPREGIDGGFLLTLTFPEQP